MGNKGVSSSVFAGVVIVLLIIAGIGYGLYYSSLAKPEITVTSTTSTTITSFSTVSIVMHL